ncbi:dodecin [Stackebrandtia soli]|uniref:dodecin n=1 Tax=Stackebrandtia soli TaxID=1892856 RepID=UPI0039EAAE6D
MSHTYRITEVVGSSRESVEDAIRSAIKRANETLRNLEWFEIGQVRGHIEDGNVGHFQVAVKVGFRLEDPNG